MDKETLDEITKHGRVYFGSVTYYTEQNMEKLDTSTIRGEWLNYGDHAGRGDDTIKSIRMVADKVNEIIEYINEKEDESKD